MFGRFDWSHDEHGKIGRLTKAKFMHFCVDASDWNSSSVDAAGVWPVSCCWAVRDGRQCLDEEGQNHDVSKSAENDAPFNQGQHLHCGLTVMLSGSQILVCHRYWFTVKWPNWRVHLWQQCAFIILFFLFCGKNKILKSGDVLWLDLIMISRWIYEHIAAFWLTAALLTSNIELLANVFLSVTFPLIICVSESITELLASFDAVLWQQ